jgi:SAM-dependent methyltransferase
MAIDHSRGWDAIADMFVGARSDIGVGTVRGWAKLLSRAGDIVDIGCGSGFPNAVALDRAGFRVFGVDASPTLVAAFRRHLPETEVVCEPAESSTFFERRFDGALAIGLLFLLPADMQREIIRRVGSALKPEGRFLFSAPRQSCTWRDRLTAEPSLSLGEDGYRRALEEAGMALSDCYVDEGENNYFDAVREHT